MMIFHSDGRVSHEKLIKMVDVSSSVGKQFTTGLVPAPQVQGPVPRPADGRGGSRCCAECAAGTLEAVPRRGSVAGNPWEMEENWRKSPERYGGIWQHQLGRLGKIMGKIWQHQLGRLGKIRGKSRKLLYRNDKWSFYMF